MSSNIDPLESLLETMQMSAGCKETCDSWAAISGLDKVLETWTAASSALSNVATGKATKKPTGLLTETTEQAKPQSHT